METMNKIVERIHEEFDTATKQLINISILTKQKSETLIIPKLDKLVKDGIFLNDIGFVNVNIAKDASKYKSISKKTVEDKQNLLKQSKEIDETITEYKKLFPFHKFISYSQVLKILEKYNLYLGHSSIYKGVIPEKNIHEIKLFPIDRLPNFLIPNINIKEPLCVAESTTNNFNIVDRRSKPAINFYICAPETNFILNNILKIGHELVKDGEFNQKSFKELRKIKKLAPKDPIVLVPVKTTLDMLGFMIVTKWGLEANDTSLVVPELN